MEDDDDNDDADDNDNKEQYDDFGNDNGGRLKGIVLPDLVKVMKWAEKNPVVSAFGMWNSDLGRRTIDFKRTIRVQQQLRRGISIGDRGEDKVLGGEDEDGEREEEEEGDFGHSGTQYKGSFITISSTTFGYGNNLLAAN